MRQCTVVTSLSSSPERTPAGLVYLVTALHRAGRVARVIDLSGALEFYDPPEDLYCPRDSPAWMNPDTIRHGGWMDEHLPPVEPQGGVVLFSAQFSPDVVFHARYSHNIRKSDPAVTTMIGGAALAGLGQEQLELVALFFDHVLVGHDVETLLCQALNHSGPRGQPGSITRATAMPGFNPDYSLMPLHDLVSVYTGHGCYYGHCRFCDFPSRADSGTCFKTAAQVAEDIRGFRGIKPGVEDIFLTQDCYPHQYLCEMLTEIKSRCGDAPLSLMLRAEPWVTEGVGEQLANVRCTEVFLGAEGFDDEILRILGKGLSARDVVRAIKALAEFVSVGIGMILFVPNVSQKALDRQLREFEAILSSVERIEPEILSVVNGSEFAVNPSKYGIILDATERVINDSWCFGLSQDIPWTMSDSNEIDKWFEHAARLRDISGDRVDPLYWQNIDRLRADIG